MPKAADIIATLNLFKELQDTHNTFFDFAIKHLQTKDVNAELTQYDYLKLLSLYMGITKKHDFNHNVHGAWYEINNAFKSVIGPMKFAALEKIKAEDLETYEKNMSALINLNNFLDITEGISSEFKTHPNLLTVLGLYIYLNEGENIKFTTKLINAIINHPEITNLVKECRELKQNTRKVDALTSRNITLLAHQKSDAKTLIDRLFYDQVGLERHRKFTSAQPDELGDIVASIIKVDYPKPLYTLIKNLEWVKYIGDNKDSINRQNSMSVMDTEDELFPQNPPTPRDPFTDQIIAKKNTAFLREEQRKESNFNMLTTPEKVEYIAKRLKELYHPRWTNEDLEKAKKPIENALKEIILKQQDEDNQDNPLPRPPQ